MAKINHSTNTELVIVVPAEGTAPEGATVENVVAEGVATEGATVETVELTDAERLSAALAAGTVPADLVTLIARMAVTEAMEAVATDNAKRYAALAASGNGSRGGRIALIKDQVLTMLKASPASVPAMAQSLQVPEKDIRSAIDNLRAKGHAGFIKNVGPKMFAYVTAE